MGCSCGAGDHLEGESTQLLTDYVDVSQSGVLNAVRPWDLQNVVSGTAVLRSDVGDDIIVRVVFSGTVKLTHIGVPAALATTGASYPSEMLLYANMPDTDFAAVAAGRPATARYALANPDTHSGSVLYPTRAVRFSHTTSLCVLLRGATGGAASIAIGGIVLYGAFKAGRIGAVHTKYEARPLLSDHSASESSVLRSVQ